MEVISHLHTANNISHLPLRWRCCLHLQPVRTDPCLDVTGGCSPFACMHKPKKQVAANSQPTPNPAKLMQVLQQQEEQQQQQQQQQQLQQAPAPDVQKPMQMTHGTSVFSRARATKSHKANQGFDTRQNQLYVAAHTRQPAEQIYDLQRPLIV